MMLKDPHDNLFALVSSLTKSEKRQFKLYVGRLGVNVDSKFMQLFSVLDKAAVYSEANILQATSITKRQLANVKSHLYKQILVSLKLNPAHQTAQVYLREQLDFASILYSKGLYLQSLKILEKSKDIAMARQEYQLAFEIIEFEKVIESQYVTHSTHDRAEVLTRQSQALHKSNVLTSQLSSLSLQLYGLLLKKGYVKSEIDRAHLNEFFKSQLPYYKWSELHFKEKLWVCKVHLWYGFLLQDFLLCYKYAVRWVELFYDEPEMIALNPSFFLKGNHYLLEALFLLGHQSKFNSCLSKLQTIVAQPQFPVSDHVAALSFLYIQINKINACFMDGSFNKGLQLIPETEKHLSMYGNLIGEHYHMVFYYKFACLQFGVENYDQTIYYLNKIIDHKSPRMREDLMCFSRILNLMAHYEAGKDDRLEADLKSVYKFLKKMNALNKVQLELIQFIRELGNIYPQDLKDAFIRLHKKLRGFEDNPLERRAFLYLDILSWLESKIHQKPVGEIVRDKNRER